MNNTKFGIYLQTLRKQNNYTQAFVAQNIGVIRQTYSHYETGRVCPSVAVLCKLADLYEIPIETLLEASDELKESEQQKSEALNHLSKKEQQFIGYFRLLDEREQEDIRDLLIMLAEKKRNKK